MTTALQLRTWHKWLGLIIGAQMLLWCVGGLYMVSMDIDFIRGLHLVREQAGAVPPGATLAPLDALRRRHGELTELKLTALADTAQPVYEWTSVNHRMLLDAITGEILSPLPQARIQRLAQRYYAGEGAIERIARLEAAPVEVRGLRAPLWRIDFDDWLQTSFYLDPDTGVLITRRHRLWRIFDAFWMLHIMDYGYERDDMNNLLLRFASAGALLFAVTGVWLLCYSFRPRRRPS